MATINVVHHSSWTDAGAEEQIVETPEQEVDRVEREIGGMELRVIGKVLFLQENRLRALEGKAPITVQQFRDALIGMMG